MSSLLLFLCISLVAPTGHTSNKYEPLLLDMKGVQKSKAKEALSLVKTRHPGRILSITRQVGQKEKHFRIKMIDPSGRVKTYFVDQNVGQISP